MNAIYALAFMGLALLGGVAADANKATLEELCLLEKSGPAITSLSEVSSLIQLLIDDQSVQCPAEVKAAILALKPIVELESVCSEEAADVIVDFWTKYVQKSSKIRSNLPKPLKKFYLGLGFQVSKVCKLAMIGELSKASAEQTITEKDFEIVTRSMKKSGKLRDIFGLKPKLESLAVVVRADASRNEKGQPERRTVVSMPPLHRTYFELVQKRCVNKFKPIYDTLISPVLRLAAIGFNYKDPLVSEKIDSFRATQMFDVWFTVVAVCEPFSKHEAVTIPAQKLDRMGNTAMVTVLDEEDIAELEKVTGLTLEESQLVEPLDYKVEVRVNDLVVDSSDKHLTKLLRWYGKGLSEMTKLRMRLIGRIPSILKLALKDNSVQFGLKPVDTNIDGKLIKFGRTSKRAKDVYKTLTTIGVFAAGIALVVVGASPVSPAILALGSFMVIIGLLFGYCVVDTLLESHQLDI